MFLWHLSKKKNFTVGLKLSFISLSVHLHSPIQKSIFFTFIFIFTVSFPFLCSDRNFINNGNLVFRHCVNVWGFFVHSRESKCSWLARIHDEVFIIYPALLFFASKSKSPSSQFTLLLCWWWRRNCQEKEDIKRKTRLENF